MRCLDTPPSRAVTPSFESRERGYVSIDVDRGKLKARMRKVSDVTDRAATVATLRTFTVESGRPGIQE